jgi:hypothetical protein
MVLTIYSNGVIITRLSGISGEGPLPRHKDIPLNEMLVAKHLRSGKAPKEIAAITGYSVWGVWKYIERNISVRAVYVETHPLRYPHLSEAPEKITIQLQRVVQ